MMRRFGVVGLAGMLAVLAGCSSTPTVRAPAPPVTLGSVPDARSATPAPAAAPASGPAHPAAPASSQAPAVTKPEAPPEKNPAAPKLPEGEYPVLVQSVPEGATVVVNGIPIGKAPQRVILPGTVRGFFRDQVSLKVRFIAADAEHASQTVEELLTPLEKIPSAVCFTPAGATRVVK